MSLRTPWHQSAQKADIPLAAPSVMLEEPKGAGGLGGMVGADFISFDFIFFFILFDIFKMEPLLQIDCLWQHELGKLGLHFPAITSSQLSLVKWGWRGGRER